MEINYLFTNDIEYLNNFTTFIPKSQNKNLENNKNQRGNMNNQNNMNDNNDFQQMDAKTIFINEIRNRIEAYFKLIVRNLRDSIPKIIGNNLVKEIENNMQIQLYNQLYKSNEMVALLSEPEHIAERRRDLTELIRVMRNAQKVIRRDPDLMTVMKIDINDSDIHPGAKDEKTISSSNNIMKDTSQNKTTIRTTMSNPSVLNNQNQKPQTNQKSYKDIFGKI
jgi:dynamin 1-like protein